MGARPGELGGFRLGGGMTAELVAPSRPVTLTPHPLQRVGAFALAQLAGVKHPEEIEETELQNAVSVMHSDLYLTTDAVDSSARNGFWLGASYLFDARGTASAPVPQERPFLADATLTIWLINDLQLWEAAIRRPVWPVRLGRSQDLASARATRAILEAGPGRQGQAVVPAALTQAGSLLRLTTAISEDRSQTRWGEYRYAATGGNREIDGDYVTSEGQAIVFLPPTPPSTLELTATR